MMTYKEVTEFLANFKTSSYNRSQIGNNRHNIITIYEFLKKLNVSPETTKNIVSNIAYIKNKDFNLALYLEILSKSIGYLNIYELEDVIKVTKDIHDVYYHSSNKYNIDDYIHDTIDTRMTKLFLNRNNKYLSKLFLNDEVANYLCDLKLYAAIALDKKDYKEFIGYFEDFQMYQDQYSPILVIKTYEQIRKSLKGNTKLFWDILFGNEYLVALNKNNIPLEEIFNKNIFKPKKEVKKELKDPVQLDIFTYMDSKENKEKEDIKYIQVNNIFTPKGLPDIDNEKDLVLYYTNLLNNKNTILLPKLKNQTRQNYIYDIN